MKLFRHLSAVLMFSAVASPMVARADGGLCSGITTINSVYVGSTGLTLTLTSSPCTSVCTGSTNWLALPASQANYAELKQYLVAAQFANRSLQFSVASGCANIRPQVVSFQMW